MSHLPERSPKDHDADSVARSTWGDQVCRVLTLPTTSDSSFDTLETQFFTEGDALNADVASAWDEPTVICGPRHHKQQRRVRWIALSAGAGMLCMGLSLWYARGYALPRNTVVITPPAAATAPTPSVAPPPPIASSAEPVPSAATVAPPPPSLPEPPAPAASPSPRSLSPEQEATGAVLSQTDSDSLAACKQAFGRRRSKAVLTDCARAFSDNPDSAEIATMLAKTEFDRGRSRQALDWAKKAVAIDENHADAYVFLGSAEQAVGHAAAARTAFRRYLQLSPHGRYAAELRMVLASL